jgi:dienelactone hydrolase
MNNKPLTILLFLLLSLASWSFVQAEQGDAGQEGQSGTPAGVPRTNPEPAILARLANLPLKEQLVNLKLSAGTSPALFMEETRGKAAGGIILLHDIDASADWPGVISPLRHALPDRGWHTLSVQLPLYPETLEPASLTALIDSALPRLNAAIDFFHGRSINNIVLIGHGFGATLAMAFIAQDTQRNTRGLVAIGMQGMAGDDEKTDIQKQLEKLTVPILDIVGSRDLDAVLKAAAERNSAMRRSAGKSTKAVPQEGSKWRSRHPVPVDARYLQVRVAGADHDFTNLDSFLERRIWGWLKKRANAAADAQ